MRLRFALLCALLLLAVTPAQARTVLGSWSGLLNFPSGQSLHFVLHVSGEPAYLAATADSPDQNSYAIHVDSIALRGQTLTFSINSIGVSYSGTLSGDAISGTFIQMGTRVPLVLRPASAAQPAPLVLVTPPPGAVTWSGMVTFPSNISLGIVLHVAHISGVWSATLDSPNQNAYGIPVDTVTESGNALRFAIAHLDLSYNGTISGNTIAGTLVQRGVSAPLTLQKQ